MDYNETDSMVEENFDAEGELPEGFVEEPDESEEMSVEEVIEDTEGSEDETTDEDAHSQELREPGYVKRRIEKALEKQAREMQAAFDAKLAPILDKMMDVEAQKLVDDGEFKTFERAKEYLQLKQGIIPEEPEPQPRNEQGQFVAKEDPVTTKQISMLAHQADAILEDTGVDVIKVFRTNENIKERVMNGEMDFYDVLREIQKPRRKPPAPMRSPNGAGGQGMRNAFETMSDEEFARIERQIDRGVRITVSK